MKIAFLADNQVDERSRLEEHDRVMDFIAHDAIERGCEVMLHGGDVFERRSTARERESIHLWLDRVTKVMPVVIAGGNHEAAGEVEELSKLRTDHTIYALERPEVLEVKTPKGREFLRVAVLPWPRRANLLAWIGRPAGHEEVEAVGIEALRQVLRGFEGSWRDSKAPKIVLAHAMVRGSRQGPDQPIAPGCDFELGIEDLALAEATVNLLGHVHMPQDWSGDLNLNLELGCVPTIYAGSPRRTAYAAGELEPKGYVVLEFDGPRLVEWERVPTPATPMVLVEATYVADLDTCFTGDPCGPIEAERPVLAGAEVRFRYQVEADERESGARSAARWRNEALREGALEVKVEEVVRPLCLARAPEVAAAKGLPDKLRAYWKARGIEMTAERQARVLARLQAIDEGVAS